MQDLSAAAAAVELRYNPDHIPSGPGGGQFTSAGGAAGPAPAKPAAKARPAAPAAPTAATKAAEKAQLLAQANADQQRITALQAQLAQVNALLGSTAKGPVQHKPAAARVTHVANPTAKPKAPAAKAKAKASSTLSRAQKLTLQQEQVTITTEIGALTAQETALRAQAAGL